MRRPARRFRSARLVLLLLLVGLVWLGGAPMAGALAAARRCDAPSRCVAYALAGFEYLDRANVTAQSPGGCGPAAFHIVLSHYGIDVPLQVLEREGMDAERGTTMRRLKEMANARGLRAEGWRIEEHHLDKVPLPAIVLYRQRHFLVVTSLDSGRFTVIDPAMGRFRVSARRLIHGSKGATLVFALDALDAKPS